MLKNPNSSKKKMAKAVSLMLGLLLVVNPYLRADGTGNPCEDIPPAPNPPIPSDHQGCVNYWHGLETHDLQAIQCAYDITAGACVVFILTFPAFLACEAGAAAGLAVERANEEALVSLGIMMCPNE